MIRVALYIIAVGLLALGVVWFADRPGEIAVTWLGLRIETSVLVALVALLALVALSILVWSLLRDIIRSPRQFSEFWRRRRSGQGHLAITKGLLAIGAGDAALARRYAHDAEKLASHEPLTLLLSAQSAQLSGDRNAAERTFRKMTQFDDTRLLGLRGLFVEAQRRSDVAGARLYAEEAARLEPSLPWAGQAVLQFRTAMGDWSGALDAVENNRSSGALDKESYRRLRAVLLTGQAMGFAESDRDLSKDAALEAVKLAPDLVPAVVASARYLSEAGDIRKATRIIEKAWQTAPHPDLADAYIHVRLGDSARERLARAKRLAEKDPAEIEGAIALARAAIDAREFVQARQALIPYLDRPTQRIALLMAALEQAESGDGGRVREWTSRALRAARDPAWTADGFVSERWMPISPVSGRINAFEWKVPLTEIANDRPDLDVTQDALPLKELEVTPPATEPRPEAAPAPVTIAERKPQPAPRSTPIAAADDIVIPTVPVPDDPGPAREPERDPSPEPTRSGGTWRRFFSW